MDYVIISLASLVVAALTLFSGFGLGTLLMPVFAIFFPVELAIAATAVVHLANNIFKIILVGRHANMRIVALFAIPAAIAAIFGALLLNHMAKMGNFYSYFIGEQSFTTTSEKIMIGSLIVLFGLFELIPTFKGISLNRKYVPVGGILSGFFGGLSGHQGALRTAFLIRLGMTKEVFVGTVVVSAVAVDVVRLAVYGMTFVKSHMAVLWHEGAIGIVAAGIVAAFLGSFVGSRLLKKVTMDIINKIVGVMLFMLGIALAVGVI